MSLDLYTRQCSLGVTAEMLSVAAGTIANHGVNPVTNKQVFETELTPKITSMIASVGFYEHTGDWMYTSGIPAKTGVGGGAGRNGSFRFCTSTGWFGQLRKGSIGNQIYYE